METNELIALIALGMFMLSGVMLAGILALHNALGKLYFKIGSLEVDFTDAEFVGDNWDADEPPVRLRQLDSNVIDFPRAAATAAAAGLENAPDKEFWDDLAALERERENLETGNSEIAVFDSLDHTRAVHERIAELKELENRAPAA